MVRAGYANQHDDFVDNLTEASRDHIKCCRNTVVRLQREADQAKYVKERSRRRHKLSTKRFGNVLNVFIDGEENTTTVHRRSVPPVVLGNDFILPLRETKGLVYDEQRRRLTADAAFDLSGLALVNELGKAGGATDVRAE